MYLAASAFNILQKPTISLVFVFSQYALILVLEFFIFFIIYTMIIWHFFSKTCYG